MRNRPVPEGIRTMRTEIKHSCRLRVCEGFRISAPSGVRSVRRIPRQVRENVTNGETGCAAGATMLVKEASQNQDKTSAHSNQSAYIVSVGYSKAV